MSVVSDAFCVSRGEAIPGNTSCGDMPRLGYLPIKPPISATFPVRPQTFQCGLNNKGDIIGSNVFVPYPGELPKYHSIPFLRNVDWSGYVESTTQPTKKPENEPVTEIAEYFTTENDEGYQKWSEKKCEEKKRLEEKQKQLKTVPETIRRQQGHFRPTITQTSNQSYGNYLDLWPRYPAVYPVPTKMPTFPMNIEVKMEKSNISTLERVSDHPFILDQPSVVDRFTQFRQNARNREQPPAHTPQVTTLVRGGFTDQREKGFTLPVYTPTGLERNNSKLIAPSPICDTARPVIYSMKVPGKIPHATTLNRKQICVPYVSRPPRKPQVAPYLANRRVVYQAVPLPGLR